MKIFLALLAIAPIAIAQSVVTPATGDSRTVAQPSIPTSICAKVQANKYLIKTTKLNIDPYNAYGTCTPVGVLGCTGGTSFEPSQSASTYIASEGTDNAAIDAALSGCGNAAVELVAGPLGQNTFVLADDTWASKNIVGDAGIYIKGSRNVNDYGGGNCGTMSTTGTTSCHPWISVTGSNGGIYGYAVWDSRGWDIFTSAVPSGSTNGGKLPSNQSFYYQRLVTYCVAHGGTTNGSPTCPSGLPSYQKAYGPNALQLGSSTTTATNFTEYLPTWRDSAQFIHNIAQTTGGTFWDVKLFAPFEVSNTDGFDPLSSTNITFTRGFISTGDNCTALKATYGPQSNFTFSYSQTRACIGLAIGTDITKGVVNSLFTNYVQGGNLYNGQSTGILISNGTFNGKVTQVTYQYGCTVNEQQSINVGYSGSGSLYTGLLFQHLAFPPSTAPYTTGKSGTFQLEGGSGNVTTSQWNDVQLGGTNQGGSMKYDSIYLGPNKVDSTILAQFAAGTSVTTANHVTTNPSAYCSASAVQMLTGELNIMNPAGLNNNQQITSAGPFTLQAVVQPTTDINSKESLPLTGSVSFYDNCTSGPTSCTPVGVAALAGDGTYAAYTIPSVSSGTHNYYAYFPGDAHYSPYQFGSVQVINGSPSTPTSMTKSGNMKTSGNMTTH